MTDSAKNLPATASVEVMGRTMVVKRPNDAQITLMHRHGLITQQALGRAVALQDKAVATQDEAERAAVEEEATPHFSRGMTSAAEILDIIEYLVCEEDREFLELKMKRGEMELSDLFGLFDAFNTKRGTGAAKKAQRIRG